MNTKLPATLFAWLSVAFAFHTSYGAHGKIFILYGPSGAGKTTLIDQVMDKKSPDTRLTQLITYTTRPPRPGEKNGIDYNFLSPSEFQEKKNNQFFIYTMEFLTASYGLQQSIEQDLAEGNNLIVAVDSPGTKKLKALLGKNAVALWIETPLEELKRRMLLRLGDTEEQITKRLLLAEQQMQQEHDAPIHDYCIVNITLASSLDLMMSIIQQEIAE